MDLKQKIKSMEATTQRQGISTKYFGPPSRIKASCAAKSMFLAWQYELNATENHQLAAIQLAESLELSFKKIATSSYKDKDNYMHTMLT